MRVLTAMTPLLLAIMNSGPLLGADDFYKGKSIRLIVSFSAGGYSDTYSRLIAKHISRHIPGDPRILVQNVPGAGGLIAANYLFNKAKQDGTQMGQINRGMWLWQVVDDKRARFDFNKINALGVPVIESALLFTRTSEFPNWKSTLRSNKLITSGNSGPKSLGYTMGKVMEKIAGKKVFHYDFSYRGLQQYSQAFRNGEVQSSGSTPSSFSRQLGDMWKRDKIAVLVQAPTPEDVRTKEFPNTPTLLDFAKTDEHRQLVKATFLLTHHGLPYAMPPGVPQERVAIMRKAFTATMNDPKFLAEAKKRKLVVNPSTGAGLQQQWKDVLNAPDETKVFIKEIFRKKKS